MAEEFKVIESQEQLNAVIGERLSKKESQIRKEYDGYLSPDEVTAKISEVKASYEDSVTKSNDKIKELNGSIEELKSKVKKYETDSVKTRIALENGIPYELANRLNGDTEEDIQKDASIMAKFIKSNGTGAPKRNQESKTDDNPLKNMLKSLKE